MEELSRMTLEDISKEIGISRTTIYKVLKNKGNVSEETCRIVNEALEKYHYVQNRNARNLAMNRHYSIGYVGFRSKSANYFSTEVGKGLKRAVKEFGDDGLSLLISEFDVENPREQLSAVEEMLKQGSYPYNLKQRILGPLGHLSNRRMAQVVAELRRRPQKLILAHLSESNNRPELAMDTVKSVLDSYGINNMEIYMTAQNHSTSVVF